MYGNVLRNVVISQVLSLLYRVPQFPSHMTWYKPSRETFFISQRQPVHRKMTDRLHFEQLLFSIRADYYSSVYFSLIVFNFVCIGLLIIND